MASRSRRAPIERRSTPSADRTRHARRGASAQPSESRTVELDRSPDQIDAPEGKLGVLLVGLGAVSTTFIAGVEAARRGLNQPIGSLTQMNTIRLGKRTDSRTPLIKDFVPLADLDDLVFGAWDPIPDNAYESAKVCGFDLQGTAAHRSGELL